MPNYYYRSPANDGSLTTFKTPSQLTEKEIARENARLRYNLYLQQERIEYEENERIQKALQYRHQNMQHITENARKAVPPKLELSRKPPQNLECNDPKQEALADFQKFLSYVKAAAGSARRAPALLKQAKPYAEFYLSPLQVLNNSCLNEEAVEQYGAITSKKSTAEYLSAGNMDTAKGPDYPACYSRYNGVQIIESSVPITDNIINAHATNISKENFYASNQGRSSSESYEFYPLDNDKAKTNLGNYLDGKQIDMQVEDLKKEQLHTCASSGSNRTPMEKHPKIKTRSYYKAEATYYEQYPRPGREKAQYPRSQYYKNLMHVNNILGDLLEQEYYIELQINYINYKLLRTDNVDYFSIITNSPAIQSPVISNESIFEERETEYSIIYQVALFNDDNEIINKDEVAHALSEFRKRYSRDLIKYSIKCCKKTLEVRKDKHYYLRGHNMQYNQLFYEVYKYTSNYAVAPYNQHNIEEINNLFSPYFNEDDYFKEELYYSVYSPDRIRATAPTVDLSRIIEYTNKETHDIESPTNYEYLYDYYTSLLRYQEDVYAYMTNIEMKKNSVIRYEAATSSGDSEDYDFYNE